MTRDAPNISTEYQPKGSGRHPSDTLDKPEAQQDKVAPQTGASEKRPGSPDVIDEKGRPLSGDGLVKRN